MWNLVYIYHACHTVPVFLQQSGGATVYGCRLAALSCRSASGDLDASVRVVSDHLSYASAICQLLHSVQTFKRLSGVLESLQSGGHDTRQNHRRLVKQTLLGNREVVSMLKKGLKS